MAFNIATAKPTKKKGFDISTAKVVEPEQRGPIFPGVSRLGTQKLDPFQEPKVAEDVAGVVEGRTLGIPRAAIDFATGGRVQLPRGSTGGQVAGGLLSGKGIFDVLSKVPKLAGKGLLKSAGRGAAAGAITTQAPSITDLDTPLVERGILAGGGALLGGIFGPTSDLVAGGISKGLKALEKVRRRPAVIQKSIKGVKQRGERDLEAIKRGDLPRQERIAEKSLARAKAKGTKIKQSITESTDELDRITAQADERINQASSEGAKQGQIDIQESIGKGRKIYSKRLDEIADVVDQSDNPFTPDELIDVIDETLDEASSIFIEEGAPVKMLNAIRKRFIPEEGVVNVELETLTMKQLLRFKQIIDKSISASAKGGSKGFVPEDIVSIIFNKRLGGKIANRAGDEFIGLQSQYGDLAELSKQAFRTKFLGKSAFQAPSKLVKRVAKGGEGSVVEEEDLIRTFEQGQGLVPPTKNSIIAGTRRAIADKKAVQSQFKKKLTAKETGDAQNLLKLQDQNDKLVGQLERRLALKSGRTKVAQEQSKKVTADEVNRLEFRLKKAMERKEKLNKRLGILKWIGIRTAGAAIGIGAFRAITGKSGGNDF